MTTNQRGQSTRAIHGSSLKDPHGAPHLPVYNTTTFAFENTQALLDVVEGRTAGPLYTRYGLNPTIFELEETMATIEGAAGALAFCSGMAAESALFAAYGRDGVVCIGDAYGGTLELLAQQFPLLGVPTTLILGSELGRLEGLLADGARLVFFETPTNPTLEVFDIRAISDVAHRHGAIVAVDNTFASPINQRPLELGADIVVYSATKYLGGHSDITAGFLVGAADLLTPTWPWRKNLGTAIAPGVADLLSRSLRTLELRVQRQNQTATELAAALETHDRVSRVLYPGLASFPGHELASSQMQGFGGMLSIEIDGDLQQTSNVAEALELFALAPSLGGVESLVTQPVTTTHHGLGSEERARRGISDSMLRLSVGLENTEDLLSDLTQALGKLS